MIKQYGMEMECASEEDYVRFDDVGYRDRRKTVGGDDNEASHDWTPRRDDLEEDGVLFSGGAE